MRLKVILATVILVAGAFYIYQKTLSPQPGEPEEVRVNEQIENKKAVNEENLISERELPSLPKLPEAKLIEPKKEVSTPGPLKSASPEPEPSSPSEVGLTQPGIILQTNLQRQQNGLGFLSANNILNATALEKANDMCEKQYFAHVSPSGIGPAQLADRFTYDYIAVGENLARGPFSSDAAVVEAWMNSPGHRANILNSKFTEIGAAAIKCTFEGKNTWLAVQHFAKPASDCPKPDAALLRAIDEKKAALTEIKERLSIIKAEIEVSDPEKDPDYNKKIASYNSLAKEHNSLVAETRSLINGYNSQAATFNVCASS